MPAKKREEKIGSNPQIPAKSGGKIEVEEVDFGDILNRARDLYLMYDEVGDHLYTQDEIVTVLRTEYGTALEQGKILYKGKRYEKITAFSQSTVQRWAKKYCWSMIWTEMRLKFLPTAGDAFKDMRLVTKADLEDLKKLLREANYEWFKRNHNLRVMSFRLMNDLLASALPLTPEELEREARGERVRVVKKLPPSIIVRIYEVLQNILPEEARRAYEELMKLQPGDLETPTIEGELSELSDDEIREQMAAIIKQSRVEGLVDSLSEVGG